MLSRFAPFVFLKAALKATLPYGREVMDRKPVGVEQRNVIIYKSSLAQVATGTLKICSGQELHFLWVLSFCQSVFQIDFDTTSVTTALKSELNVLWRTLFITTQMEREYFPFERSCQTCPGLCLLSEALWSFLWRKGDEGKKGQKQSGREQPSRITDQKFSKKVQGWFQLETAALCGHKARSLGSTSVTPWICIYVTES